MTMHIPESTLLQILASWPMKPPSSLTPLAGGTNNQVWLVHTEDGPSSVLRVITGVIDLPGIRYETALLSALHATSLPFALPLPCQTRAGDIFVPIHLNKEEEAVAMLTPFLSGQMPPRDLAHIVPAGIALAQLDLALATIAPASLPSSMGTSRFLYGNLAHCHPLVTNPCATVERLLDAAQARALLPILEQAQHDWESLLTQNLPQQLLHRDYGPGNMLMEQERVTAILDFEFAGPDRRIFDLSVAISWWPVRLMGTGQEWELIDALGRAYTSYVPLTEAELRALPATQRLRDTTSLVYRMGRYLAGQESLQTIQERVRHSLWREEWLQANQQTLIEHALRWREQTHPQSTIASPSFSL